VRPPREAPEERGRNVGSVGFPEQLPIQQDLRVDTEHESLPSGGKRLSAGILDNDPFRITRRQLVYVLRRLLEGDAKLSEDRAPLRRGGRKD
jgi:hypothetical protein